MAAASAAAVTTEASFVYPDENVRGKRAKRRNKKRKQCNPLVEAVQPAADQTKRKGSRASTPPRGKGGGKGRWGQRRGVGQGEIVSTPPVAFSSAVQFDDELGDCSGLDIKRSLKDAMGQNAHGASITDVSAGRGANADVTGVPTTPGQ